MYNVILCGGSGTRLWPLSRKNYPKQFLKLLSDKSLLQETYLRIRKVMPQENIFFVTNRDNYFNVFNQINDIEKGFRKDQVIVEPKSLSTAPAMALSCKYITEKFQVSEDAPIIFLPSDHYIKNVDNYAELVEMALKNVGDAIGTIGITPMNPNTGLGYIKKGEKKENYYQVEEFKEKPDEKTAQEYIDSKKYLWNAGMYLFNTKTLMSELKSYCPEIYGPASLGLDEFMKQFEKLPSVSIDYAVSEKSSNVITFEGDFGWNDIGSFDSLAEINEKDPNPRHISIDSKHNYVHTDSNRLIATLGVENLNIIETADSILVQKQGLGEDVKKIVDYLKKNKLKELEHNLIVHRPWGRYEVLIDGPNHKVKKITVYPEAKLSLQSHKSRAEHWVVIKGTALVINGEKEITLKENESTYIPALAKHRLSNPGQDNLEIIEVQTGSYLEEDDITRYDDVYERN